MKKLLLMALLLGLTGCGEDNQSNSIKTDTQPIVSNQREALNSQAPIQSSRSAIAPSLRGWTVKSTSPLGSGLIIDAEKLGVSSSALIKPTPADVAKVLRGGAAGIALSIAVDQLLGAVDWVLDPENNQIKYKIPPKPKKFRVGASLWTDFDSYQKAYSYAQQQCKNGFYLLSDFKLTVQDSNNKVYDQNFRCITTYSSNIYIRKVETITANLEEKMLPLEEVAKQVISNADDDSLEAQVATGLAAQSILNEAYNDDAKAEPIANELERNVNNPPCVTISGKVVAVGTYGYRHDIVPPSKPHYPFTGDHYNLYRANQNPNNGKCFWVESGAVDASNGQLPPPNSIPIEPFI